MQNGTHKTPVQLQEVWMSVLLHIMKTGGYPYPISGDLSLFCTVSCNRKLYKALCCSVLKDSNNNRYEYNRLARVFWSIDEHNIKLEPKVGA